MVAMGVLFLLLFCLASFSRAATGPPFPSVKKAHVVCMTHLDLSYTAVTVDQDTVSKRNNFS